jgi:hypothetical protein
LKELLRKQAMVLAYSYEQKVNCLIREKYSIDAEFAILRQRDTKPEEFAAYNEYVEQCKAAIKAEMED